MHKQRVQPLVGHCASSGCPNVWTIVGDTRSVIVQGFAVAAWPRMGLARSDAIVTLPTAVYLAAASSHEPVAFNRTESTSAGVWTADGDGHRVFVRGSTVRRMPGITVARGEALVTIPTRIFHEGAVRLRSRALVADWSPA